MKKSCFILFEFDRQKTFGGTWGGKYLANQERVTSVVRFFEPGYLRNSDHTIERGQTPTPTNTNIQRG
jgi:hypothetical protein